MRWSRRSRWCPSRFVRRSGWPAIRHTGHRRSSRSRGGQRLVLRAAVKRVHLRALVLGLDHTFAANRAGVAGVVVFEDRVGHRLARQRLGPRKGAAQPVAGWESAHRVLEHEHAGGAVVLHPLHVREVRKRARGLARQFGHGLLIRHVDLAVAAHRDRLQVLAAHHRAHAGAAVGTIGHVDDACQPREALARGADLRHLDLRVAQLFLDGGLRVPGDLPPEMPGVAQLRFSVVYPQVDRLGAAAGEDDAVETGELELGRPETARLAVAD